MTYMLKDLQQLTKRILRDFIVCEPTLRQHTLVNNNILVVAFAQGPPFATVIYRHSFHLQTGWEASSNRGSTLGPVLFTQPAETRISPGRKPAATMPRHGALTFTHQLCGCSAAPAAWDCVIFGRAATFCHRLSHF